MKALLISFALGAFVAALCYLALTESICRDIRAGQVSVEVQTEMGLSVEKCNGPVWGWF